MAFDAAAASSNWNRSASGVRTTTAAVVPAVSSASGRLVTRRPLSRMTTWSTVWETSASRWLDTTTVRPASAWLRRNVRSQCTPSGSRPLVGSSRTSTDGFAQQGGGQAEALTHAEGEAADAAAGVLGHADLGQRVVDPLRRQSRGGGEDAQVVDRPAPGVKARRLQHGAHLAGGFVEVDVAAAVERGAAGGRGDEAEQHPQRGGLAGAVRAEEPGDGAGLQLEGQVVDGGDGAEAFGETVEFDGGHDVSFRIGRRRSPGLKETMTESGPPCRRTADAFLDYSPGRMRPLS